jgi:hypothetical protein
MSDKQLGQLLAAISDLQVSLDALGIDVEDLRKGACKDRHEPPPGWVTRASRLSDSLEDESDALFAAHLTAAQDSVVAYIALAALAGSAATALFMLLLVGG